MKICLLLFSIVAHYILFVSADSLFLPVDSRQCKVSDRRSDQCKIDGTDPERLNAGFAVFKSKPDHGPGVKDLGTSLSVYEDVATMEYGLPVIIISITIAVTDVPMIQREWDRANMSSVSPREHELSLGTTSSGKQSKFLDGNYGTILNPFNYPAVVYHYAKSVIYYMFSIREEAEIKPDDRPRRIYPGIYHCDNWKDNGRSYMFSVRQIVRAGYQCSFVDSAPSYIQRVVIDAFNAGEEPNLFGDCYTMFKRFSEVGPNGYQQRVNGGLTLQDVKCWRTYL